MRASPRIVLAGVNVLLACCAALGLASVSLLYVSLERGRTTPQTLSREWLAAFFIVALSLVLWSFLWSGSLQLASRLGWRGALRGGAISLLPLLSALPLVQSVYASDEAFHYFTFTPVARSLAIWSPVAAAIACQIGMLVWYTRLPSGLAALLKRRAAIPVLIFLSFASLYIFSAGGHMYSPDERDMYAVTESLANGHIATSYRGDGIQVEGGWRLWSKYGIVPSALAVPAYFVARALGLSQDPPSPAFPIPDPSYPLVDLLVSPLVTAATCSVLYLMGRRLGFRAATSLLIVLIFGLSTSSWAYAKTFFGQPAAALFFTAFFYLLLSAPQARVWEYCGAGAMLGVAAGARFEALLFAIPMLGFMAYLFVREPRRYFVPAAGFALALMLAFGVSSGWYNYVKTGSFLSTGYGDEGSLSSASAKPYIGLFGILASPGFGTFVYNPIAALGAFSLTALIGRRRWETVVLAFTVALAVCFYGFFRGWAGGFTWAARFMIVVLPLLVLPIGVLLERPWRSILTVLGVAFLALVGFGINLLAVLIDFNNGWLDLWDHNASLSQIEWDPHFSPIGAHLRVLNGFLATGAKLDLYLYFKWGLPSLALLVLFLALLVLGARATKAADRREEGSETQPHLTLSPSSSTQVVVGIPSVIPRTQS